jgi:methylase of polypeptide subunit release factors
LNQSIYNFLKKYDNDVISVNRLLVSTFVHYKKLQISNNILIKSLLIYDDNELEFQKLQQFINLVEKNDSKFCFEELLELFEFVISPSDKLVNGAIYTPSDIRQFITNNAFKKHINQKNIANFRVVDIACGCGGFLIDATRLLKKETNKTYKEIYANNIFGVDIQEYSIERTKILLSLLALEKGEDEELFVFNLYQGDSLKFNWFENNEIIQKDNGFDIILGNPPYVCSRNMDDDTKQLMQNWSSCSTGHPDLYIPFFQIATELLKENGLLGYITVNSFINSVNGRAIRQYFVDKEVGLEIIDFGSEQIFKGRLTYTCLCFIENNCSNTIKYIMYSKEQLSERKDIKYKNFKYNMFDSLKGWNLKDNILINKLEKNGTPFGEIYDTKSGIATLKNHVYIFKPIDEDDEYYYLNENTPIEKTICKDIINSNKLTSNKIDNLIQKMIFPYKHNSENQPVLIEEDDFKNDFPKTYQYLLTQKELLKTRDKGNGNYPAWYAFGRTQSLEKKKHKLFFPQLVKKGFKTIYNDNEDLYFYNGMCAYASKKELKALQKIMKSDEFWSYVENKAKHYNSGYYGLGRNYLKDFGITFK